MSVFSVIKNNKAFRRYFRFCMSNNLLRFLKIRVQNMNQIEWLVFALVLHFEFGLALVTNICMHTIVVSNNIEMKIDHDIINSSINHSSLTSPRKTNVKWNLSKLP